MFDPFLDALARTPAPADAVNPYAYGNANNDIRRTNLRIYLQRMARLEPTAMLVAEAPGYRGTRLTGVPFSSRYLLLEGVPGLAVFGREHGYRIAPDAADAAYKEQTATIVWSTLPTLSTLPINWNSYPFHPHQPGASMSNRKPRQPELEIGRRFLTWMLDLFPVQTIIAVGNTASESLARLEIPHDKVRHPAQGGKNDFVAGITALLGHDTGGAST